MYRWVVFLHILSAFAFFMAHGASALMAFRLRRERGIDRIRAILDLSNAALPAAYLSLMVLVLAGIAAGAMGHWFSQGWIWTAIVLLVVLWIGMFMYASRFYAPIRKAVGLPYRDRQGEHPAEPPASEAEITALVQAANPLVLLVPSFALIAVILWLMMFKPF
jgi:small-conductance mechanosensitive channel